MIQRKRVVHYPQVLQCIERGELEPYFEVEIKRKKSVEWNSFKIQSERHSLSLAKSQK